MPINKQRSLYMPGWREAQHIDPDIIGLNLELGPESSVVTFN